MNNERLQRALRLLKETMPRPELMDTPGKAAAEGVPIGTTVLRSHPPTFLPDAQAMLDLRRTREMWAAGLVELPE